MELSCHTTMRLCLSQAGDVHRVSLTYRESNAKYIWLGSANPVSVGWFLVGEPAGAWFLAALHVHSGLCSVSCLQSVFSQLRYLNCSLLDVLEKQEHVESTER